VKALLLLSIVIAALVIPMRAARDPNPRRGVKRMLLWLFLFNALYLAYMTQIHTVVFVPKW